MPFFVGLFSLCNDWHWVLPSKPKSAWLWNNPYTFVVGILMAQLICVTCDYLVRFSLRKGYILKTYVSLLTVYCSFHLLYIGSKKQVVKMFAGSLPHLWHLHPQPRSSLLPIPHGSPTQHSPVTRHCTTHQYLSMKNACCWGRNGHTRSKEKVSICCGMSILICMWWHVPGHVPGHVFEYLVFAAKPVWKVGIS